MKHVAVVYQKRIHPVLPEKTQEYFKEIEDRVKINAASMARQFDRKKKAFEVRNRNIRQSGSINISRLAYYKTSDEIFSSVSYDPDGKSHGIYALVDFSISMSGIITSAIEEAYTLAVFCEKVGIPFRIVSFTNDTQFGYNRAASKKTMSGIDIADLRMNLMFSNTRSVTENNSIFRMLTLRFSGSSGYSSNRHLPSVRDLTPEYRLSGTPLEDAMVVAYDEVHAMKKANSIQNMLFVTITDGSGAGSPANTMPTGRFVDYHNGNAVYQFENRCPHSGTAYRSSSVWYANMMDVARAAGIRTMGIYLTGDQRRNPTKKLYAKDLNRIKNAFNGVHYYFDGDTTVEEVVKKFGGEISKYWTWIKTHNYAGLDTFVFVHCKNAVHAKNKAIEVEYRMLSQSIADELCAVYKK